MMMAKNWRFCSFTVAGIFFTGIVGLTSAIAAQPPAHSKMAQSSSTRNPQKLPFVGTRFFNFLGGSGTGQSITIAADGNTTIQLHGTMSTSIQYRGKFSNPIRLKDGLGLLFKGNKIYQLSTNGQVSNGCMGEGKPCESTLQPVSAAPASPIAAEDGFSKDDDRFIQQNFSRSLFQQVHQINRQCGFYDVTSSCSVRIYAFKNASLITQRNGTEWIKNTLTLYQPVSKQQALAYVKILNDGKALAGASSKLQADKIVYRGCPYDAGATEPATLCEAELFLTSDGKISGVTLKHISP